MKRFITLMLIAGWVLNSYSQEVIELEETTLTFEPTGEIVFEDYENGIIRVKEKFAAQFQSNAIGFLKENFDINKFREETGYVDGNVLVSVTSSRGQLNATYNDDNEIVRTYQKFKDVALPYDVRNEVYAQFPGWTLAKDRYIAFGNEDRIDEEKYFVYLKRGKDREKIKITPARSSVTGVAMLEKF